MNLATLLTLCISSDSFSGVFTICYSNMSPVDRDYVASSFPIWMPFISFSCLIYLVLHSNMMLKTSGKSRHLFLISEEKLLTFYHWIQCWLWVYCLWPLLCWDMFLTYSILSAFIMKECSILSNFFLNLLRWSYYFIILLMWYIIFIDLYMSKSLHSRVKSHSVIVCDYFNVLLN